MAISIITASATGSALEQILQADDIQPGSSPSYELCKLIYVNHVLGAKLVDKPIEMAQSQPRDISIPDSPEERVRDAFVDQWGKDGADAHVANLMGVARTYGIGSVALVEKGKDAAAPLKLDKLFESEISFNIFDPLNTAGSLVLNQNPNAMDFQHVVDIQVSGQRYHRSRTCVMMNEKPIYIEYTPSAFGFVGRSVYQRTLYPLKSFLQSMVTNDMVTKKAGLIVAMMKQAGSIIDQVMSTVSAQKRQILKGARTDNVISIGVDEKIETLNMVNTDVAMTTARKNILDDLASGAAMPAKVLTEETFAEGFGEGTEDARMIARWVKRQREGMARPYAYMDRIIQRRAWSPEFYATIQREFSEYRRLPYESAYYRWQNSFRALWPSFIEEPDSEKAKADDVKLKAAVAVVQILLPALPGPEKATLIQWLADNLNELQFLYSNPLVLDYEAIAEFEPMDLMGGDETKPNAPFSAQDAVSSYNESVVRYLGDRGKRRMDAKSERLAQLLQRLAG